jgi:beta-phosphoglucomutase-like phosphatase (HAD superfamily)
MVGLGDLFTTSVTLDDVSNRKLHPEPYLKATELVGAEPSVCLIFEDSIAGFKAARAAGIMCVGVGDVALSAEGDDALDMVISSFVGFDITITISDRIRGISYLRYEWLRCRFSCRRRS